jgi:hypothetical protein
LLDATETRKRPASHMPGFFEDVLGYSILTRP